jgi:hypothetical protein
LITSIMPVFTLGDRNARRPGTSVIFTKSRLWGQLGNRPQLATFWYFYCELLLTDPDGLYQIHSYSNVTHEC